MIRNAREALALLERHGLMTLVPARSSKGAAAPPSLLFEIVREKVKGSWWAHPKGKLVFGVATALEKSALVHARSEHTERGHHETALESWSAWAARAGAKKTKSAPSFDDALLMLERAGLRF